MAKLNSIKKVANITGGEKQNNLPLYFLNITIIIITKIFTIYNMYYICHTKL